MRIARTLEPGPQTLPAAGQGHKIGRTPAGTAGENRLPIHHQLEALSVLATIDSDRAKSGAAQIDFRAVDPHPHIV